jgi:hypothetical protein
MHFNWLEFVVYIVSAVGSYFAGHSIGKNTKCDQCDKEIK